LKDMRIRTERLLLRPWVPADAAALLEMRARPEVARWMADPVPWSERAQAEKTIAHWAEVRTADSGLGGWAVVADDVPTPIGSVSLQPIPKGDGEIEIGWMLHPDAWGRGHAREAAGAVLAHGLSIGLTRIWALMWPGNEPSARVCRVIGMQDLGVRPDPWYGGESHMFRVDAGPGLPGDAIDKSEKWRPLREAHAVRVT
jgi:RimJ/RimL family protein N-acetyltransferase